MDKPLGYWDFIKAAFKLRVPVPLLGELPVNKLMLAAFVILGIGNPGFLLLGLAYEAAYLTLLAGSPRFQNLTLALSGRTPRETWGEKEQGMLNRLDQEARERYSNLIHRCRTILQIEPGFEADQSLANLKKDGLSQLLAIYLRLLSLRQRIEETLSRTKLSELEENIKELTSRIEKEPENSAVRRALQGTLEIQQARLENLKKSQENLVFTETELNRIDKQVDLVAEEIATSKDPEQLSLTLDSAVKSIQGANKWMSDNSDLFSSMEIPAVLNSTSQQRGKTMQ